VRWLARKTNQKYRLLSESEWEYAARAGTKTPFWSGNTISPDQANYDGSYTYGGGPAGVFRQKTTDVGSFSANNFGLHDSHGNVWEWVEDCLRDDYIGVQGNGDAWAFGICTARVRRGGSWYSVPDDLRSASRGKDGPEARGNTIGFRVARTIN